MADRDFNPLLALDLTPKEREKDLKYKLCTVYSRALTNSIACLHKYLVFQCPVSICRHLPSSLSADRTSFVRSPQDLGAHPWVGLELDTARIQKHEGEAGTRKRKERRQAARPPQDEPRHAGFYQVRTQPTLGALLGKGEEGMPVSQVILHPQGIK